MLTRLCLTLVLAATLSGGSHAEVTLFFGGDTSHGENYQAQTEAAGGSNVLEEQGYNAAFEHLLPLMQGADLRVLNLETPLTNRRVSPVENKISYLWSDPVKAPRALKRFGVDVVSLANNHALDFGPDGMGDTLRALDAAGIEHFGAGKNLAEAEQPYLVTLGNSPQPIRIAIIGTFERRESYEQFDFYAEADRPGVNPITIRRLASQITDIKAVAPETFVIVTPHWGQNYVWRTQQLRDWAEGMIDAGADMVIGHGAHRFQEIELINHKWVFYSIGNFVFNSPGSFKKRKSHAYSLPLRIGFRHGKDGVATTVRGYPILADNRRTNYKPRPVTTEELRDVRSMLSERDTTGALAAYGLWTSDRIGPCLELDLDRDPLIVDTEGRTGTLQYAIPSRDLKQQ